MQIYGFSSKNLSLFTKNILQKRILLFNFLFLTFLCIFVL
nr:MAG TPA: hypothetical protein [Caudoviricetes sp.]